MTITTTMPTTTPKRRSGSGGRRHAALLSAGALALACAVALCCYAPVQPAAALFWPRLGFSAANAFDDVWDHHLRAVDHLNAVTNALFHPHTRAAASTAAATAASAEAPAAAQHKHWQPLRAADSAWDRLIAAQAKQWACSQHCRARARATLPYEASVSERTDACRPAPGPKCAPTDVEIALRLPNVKPNDVHVQVVGGDTLSLRATRAPRTHAPTALDAECACAQRHTDADADADAHTDADAPAAVEVVERTYSLGRFVDPDRITATVSQQPDTSEGAAAGDFVTTVTVKVPKAVRPDTKRIALSEVAAAVDAPAAVAAIAAPDATAAEPAPDAAAAEAAAVPAATEATAAAPAAATPDAAAAAEEPQFGTTAVAANSAALPPRATSDATDEVINL